MADLPFLPDVGEGLIGVSVPELPGPQDAARTPRARPAANLDED